ncbi:short-chain dehydrogenase/reductase SDR [Tepidicaulis marinus]|uniref:Short-chain dehydrogenase/reductase SDR n=1 Tax=Tepidicaulis marinus TaxID=1333998 RepID=A0A081B697_9HYPH|nr:SDR family NAD(P)-dependent oxidoreductase [Tepidicaulis marinus]GAK43565.1 short-chain dehydrogenase/reductase SDR [Tepidicaulis marinus]
MRKTQLASFGTGLSVALYGASGGIGTALREALLADPAVERVFAFSRRSHFPAHEKLTAIATDIRREEMIADGAALMRAEGPLHLVLVASGILHGDDVRPEKSWRQIEAGAMEEVLRVNTLAPALIAKHTLPLLARGRKSCFAALSARIGSISDNKLGGWHAYRASKAALNMLIRTFAIELARKNEEALTLALHPGTVDTDLSAPFQRGLPEGQVQSPEETARHLLKVIDEKGPGESGRCFAFDGTEIAP